MKKILKRCLLGAPIGLAISILITIIISYAVGDGGYHAVVPALVSDCGSEIDAVTLQAAVSMLYGAAWAGASLIWENESWSILRMTITHLIICSAATFPVAFFLRWMERSAKGIALYFGMFAGIYAVVWISQYCAMKRKIDAINSKISERAAN